MNKEQKICFKAIYDFIHDERIQCQNLAAVIDFNFPEIDGQVSEVLHKQIKPYLEIRQNLGAETMELMYLLNEIITEETISAGG